MTQKTHIKKILLADDHAIVRKGLKQIISEGINNVEIEEATTGAEAEQMARGGTFDVIVLDISLPEKNGLDVLKQLIESDIKSRIIILSIYPENQYGVRVLKAGAWGFLNKDSAPSELTNAINTLLSGRKYITPGIAQQMAEQLSTGKKLPHELLSDREFQVMQMLTEGTTVNEIADHLNLSPATVNTYRARVLEKLNVRNNAELTRYAIETGLNK